MPEPFDFFATCAPGVEPALHAEAKELRLAKVERQVGGVGFCGTMADAWRANLWLRTAIRVLRRVARFRATSGDELYAAARDVAWEELLAPAGSLLVDARSRRSRLDHTHYVEQRVKDAVVDRFRERAGARPDVDKERPDLRINAHLFEDRVTLSVDTSGDSLHKRGWRRRQGRAPLAETTAAALVLLSGWDRRAPLLDPFCGSGTILVEAALLASRVAPGLRRRFGFEGWLDHDAAGFAAVKERARAEAVTPRKLRLLGWDVDPARVEEARENAAAAGVDELVSVDTGDARELDPRPGWNAWIVTNPPYGERVGRPAELRALYRRFGDVLHQRCAGYRLGLLSGNPRLRKELGYPRAKRTPIVHGGLDCEFLQVERL